jgi:hypothetical protein
MNNNTIAYEKHCIENLTKELSEPKRELVQDHLNGINTKFNLLLEEQCKNKD